MAAGTKGGGDGNGHGNGGGPQGAPAGGSDFRERRRSRRVQANFQVDYRHADTFLFSYITNISVMGIFVRSEDPLPSGTELRLRFATAGGEGIELDGEVVWINPYRPGGENLNPGMGIRFINLSPEMRERLVELVRTIAYLRDEDEDQGPKAS